MHEDFEVKHCVHGLNTTREEMQEAIYKVGNSAEAIRKELGLEQE